ncbi:TetR/AcrR family transcriptional regulator C-terminal domain-containing protein [Amycolatopsis taiwanensis]|uniref:TetR/AcrR family transcriptional regulator C-terminal domain-containing protein n=1 Tax=Amycolatopsis taiwanensis TaxID=342230 RepID=UPI000483E1CF|nr:TetR/AcrR family transcriptional regulator C-terminal domain-containing protein [Amycolatopsis taiwanensis]
MPSNRTRGQRAGLTRQAVLEAAMALADREGLKALSMRRLGTELGVEAMTLYHHVSNKDALLDGLVEQLLTEAIPSRIESESWQAGLRGYAHSLLATLLAHPNVTSLIVSRPAVTARNLRIMEDLLEALRAAGFPLDVGLDVLYSLAGFVVGHVVTHPESGETLGQVRQLSDVDAEEFPLLAEAAARTERRPGPDSRFDFALDAMLTGFEAARTNSTASQ